jgi:phage terminase small subunit
MELQEEIKKAKKLFEAGNSFKQISVAIKRPSGTIRRWKSNDKARGLEWVQIIKKKTANEQKKTANKKTGIKGVKSVRKDKVLEPEIVAEKEKHTRLTIASEHLIKDDSLSIKEKLFCSYYVEAKGGTQAAIKAGYSPKTAYSKANTLLKKSEIKKHIQQIKSEIINNVIVSAEEIVKQQVKIAKSDITSVIKIEENEKGALVVKVRKDLDGSLVKKFKFGKQGFEVELWDKHKALEFLGKYAGIDPDLQFKKEPPKEVGEGETEFKFIIEKK